MDEHHALQGEPPGDSRWLLAGGPGVALAAALVPGLRPIAALAAVAGWAVLHRLRRPEAVAWAAVVPVALVLPWPWILGPDAPLGEPACASPVSAIVTRRLVVASIGLGAVAVLARAHRSSAVELGLRRPRRFEGLAAVAAVLAVAMGGLVVGPWLARPFFGELDFPQPAAALLPAVLFGVANGVLEEVGYRGAMQAWLGRAMPVGWAIGVQALVFGFVHAGPEVLALLPVHIALMSAVGAAGGIVRARSGAVWLPLGVHVGADVALYVGLACRAPA